MGEGDAKRFSHVRTLSLRAGSRCGERVSEKREGHANRRLHVCHPSLSPVSLTRSPRALRVS